MKVIWWVTTWACFFFEALVAEIRQRHYSIRTEQVYELWVCRFILFNNADNPEQLGATEVVSFLQYLAVNR